VLRFAKPIRSRSPSSDDRWLGGPCGVSGEAGAALVVSIVRSLSRLGSWRRILPANYEFAYTL
jgi:hypothetical protein